MSYSATTAETALASWLSACESNPWTRLTTKAAKPYGYIWQSWVNHLGSTAWDEATGKHLASFLATIQPHSETSHQASDISRRRYWRVIDRIYEHAQINYNTTCNPAQELATVDIPPSEDSLGVVLSPRMLNALIESIPAPVDAIAARDRAMLLTLMELAITSQELCDIELSDLNAGFVEIRGKRKSQARLLPVSKNLTLAIDYYRKLRNRFGITTHSTRLFVSREDPRLPTAAVQRVVSTYIKAAAYRAHVPLPPKRGAQVIRNTTLLHWLLSGTPISQVVQNAGLQSPRAFTHLRQHLPRDIRAIVATSDMARD